MLPALLLSTRKSLKGNCWWFRVMKSVNSRDIRRLVDIKIISTRAHCIPSLRASSFPRLNIFWLMHINTRAHMHECLSSLQMKSGTILQFNFCKHYCQIKQDCNILRTQSKVLCFLFLWKIPAHIFEL